MQESGENYLETIYNLTQKHGRIKSVDVAKELGYSKPSVSRAVKILKNDGFLTTEDGNYLKLTAQGEKKAKEIADKHEYITEYLIRILHLGEDVADKDACRIEHVISPETFYEMKNAVLRHKKMFDKVDEN